MENKQTNDASDCDESQSRTASRRDWLPRDATPSDRVTGCAHSGCDAGFHRDDRGASGDRDGCWDCDGWGCGGYCCGGDYDYGDANGESDLWNRHALSNHANPMDQPEGR